MRYFARCRGGQTNYDYRGHQRQSEKLHALQRAFLEEQAAQCGYCTGGIIMTAYALLATNAHPDDAEIRAALDGNICRCGTHARILRAIKKRARSV